MAPLVAAVLPYLLTSILGVAAGGYAGWQLQSGRVALAQLAAVRAAAERDQLSVAVADRDTALAQQQRSQRQLSDAAAQCSASVTMLADAAARRESEAVALREDVRRYLEPTRAAIARLGARIAAGGPAAGDCREALDEWRAETRPPLR